MADRLPRTVLSFVLLGFYVFAIALHALVIVKIIPYALINGGLSPSYEAQAVQSAVSIAVFTVLATVVFLISWRDAPRVWQKWFVYILTGVLVLGLGLQFIGTDFERFVISWLLLVGVIAHVMLILAIRRRGATNIP